MIGFIFFIVFLNLYLSQPRNSLCWLDVSLLTAAALFAISLVVFWIRNDPDSKP